MSTWSRPSRARLWSRLASRYLRDPRSPYGPGHMSQPALVEITSSSRRPAKSSRRTRPGVDLRAAVRRAVVVGQVEVRDPEVERPPHDRPGRLDRPVVAEVPPEAQREQRQLQAAAAAAPVGHRVVAVGRRRVRRVGHAGDRTQHARTAPVPGIPTVARATTGIPTGDTSAPPLDSTYVRFVFSGRAQGRAPTASRPGARRSSRPPGGPSPGTATRARPSRCSRPRPDCRGARSSTTSATRRRCSSPSRRTTRPAPPSASRRPAWCRSCASSARRTPAGSGSSSRSGAGCAPTPGSPRAGPSARRRSTGRPRSGWSASGPRAWCATTCRSRCSPTSCASCSTGWSPPSPPACRPGTCPACSTWSRTPSGARPGPAPGRRPHRPHPRARPVGARG